MTSFARNNQAKRWHDSIRIAIHIDGDDDLLVSRTKSHTAQRADIAKIAAPCESDVSGGRHQVIGGIEIRFFSHDSAIGVAALVALGSKVKSRKIR